MAILTSENDILKRTKVRSSLGPRIAFISATSEQKGPCEVKFGQIENRTFVLRKFRSVQNYKTYARAHAAAERWVTSE